MQGQITLALYFKWNLQTSAVMTFTNWMKLHFLYNACIDILIQRRSMDEL